MSCRYRNLHYRGIVLAMIGMLVYSSASGHIKNEATQFPDIEFSAARFDIVVLVGAGIIPETPVFEPDKALSNEELAVWAALTAGLGRGGENADTSALAAAAISEGIVDSLAGNASFADLNRVFFAGNLDIDDEQGTPSKADAASLIATALSNEVGQGLLERRELEMGVGGDVTEVTIKEGHHGNAYVLTIGGTQLQMDEHGRVANGPTDLLQWEGLRVRRSFVRGSGDHALWIYLEAEPPEPAPVVVTAAASAATSEAAAEVVDEPPADRSILYLLVAIAVILGAGLFFQSRRSN